MRLLPEALKRPIKAWLKQRRSKQRALELERSEPHVTRERLAADLRALGIAEGDVLFVHSSLKSLGFVEGGAESVLGALRDAVGASGSLLLPAYWIPGGTLLGTCELSDYEFDPSRHGTHMGALPGAVLAQADMRRSLHPTHSCAAVGPLAAYLTEAHHLAPSVFGEGSPWQRFAELPQGKVLGLGITMGPVTFYHRLEDELGAAFPEPVWLERTYRLPCRDADGRRVEVPVRPFDPALSARRIDHKPNDALRRWFAAEFERAGLKRNGAVGQAQSWVIPGVAFLAHLHQLARQGVTIYSRPEQLPPQ